MLRVSNNWRLNAKMFDHRLCILETRRKNEVVENLRLSRTTNKVTHRLKTTWQQVLNSFSFSEQAL